MARVVFLGSKALGLSVLRAVLDTIEWPHQLIGVICPDDSHDGRSELEQFRVLAAQQGIPFRVIANSLDAQAAIAECRPDIGLVVGWYQLIKLDQLPATRFFGFHASLLPKYRGNTPLVWQIICGESTIGMSFFEIAGGMDQGGIVTQAQLPLGADETIADALRYVEASCVQMIRSRLLALLEGTALLGAQDHAQATYCGLRTPEDGRIDWRQSARQIHDFIRAQTKPYPGAFTQISDGRRLRTWRSAVDQRPYVGVPGAIAERAPGVVVVTCGQGAIRLLDAEIEGVAHQPVDALLPSLRLRLV